MRSSLREYSAIGVVAFALAGFPLTGLASAPVSHAEDDCDYSFYMNYATNQCQFCDDSMTWNYDTNQCLAHVYVDPNVYVGPNPIVGPVGPVGVGGVGPVAGPVGPVGVGGPAGPGGPGGPGRIGIGR